MVCIMHPAEYIAPAPAASPASFALSFGSPLFDVIYTTIAAIIAQPSIIRPIIVIAIIVIL